MKFTQCPHLLKCYIYKLLIFSGSKLNLFFTISNHHQLPGNAIKWRPMLDVFCKRFHYWSYLFSSYIIMSYKWVMIPNMKKKFSYVVVISPSMFCIFSSNFALNYIYNLIVMTSILPCWFIYCGLLCMYAMILFL